MTSVFESLSRAFRDLFQFQVLWIVIWPILVASLLWLLLGVAFWSTFSGWIASGLTAIGIQTWLQGVEPSWVAYGIQAIAHLILFVPLVFVTALVITALFAGNRASDPVCATRFRHRAGDYRLIRDARLDSSGGRP